jgi:nicotinate dehydrogenase subunit B
VPATGAGETAITVTPAAIGNAIFDATNVRLRTLPFTPERVRAALLKAGHKEA